MARRIPPGQISKAYKRLYDVWQRYTNRWEREKGYVNASHFNRKLSELLQSLQVELEGGDLSALSPRQERRSDQFGFSSRPAVPRRDWGGGQRIFDTTPPGIFDESDEEEVEDQGSMYGGPPAQLPTRRYTQGMPVSLRSTGTRTRRSIKPLIPTRLRRKSSKKR